MNHKKKVKIARGMLSIKEREMKVPKFQSNAWLKRAASRATKEIMKAKWRKNKTRK